MNVLVLNAGSATLKFGFYGIAEEGASSEAVLARGIVEHIGSDQAHIRYEGPSGHEPTPVGAATASEAARQVLQLAATGRLADDPQATVQAVGCRVVHGGPNFDGPVRVTPSVLGEIRALASLAPLHNPIDADVLEEASQSLPQAPVAAVFDTAFHHTLPEVAFTYALPWDLCQKHHLRRYGFHGISHRYVSERLLECLNRGAAGSRLITCHLGNGASICAIRDGRSVDTSMGLTPLEGLVMGSRSGDVDPGLLLYLQRCAGFTVEALDDLLNRRSGLTGVSGRSGDVRELDQAAAQGDTRAELALELFAYRVSKYIGAYAAVLEGLDAVAFTGGIGEHSGAMRSRICRRLAFLGLRLAEDRNNDASGAEASRISTDDAGVQAWVIPTDEELQIAREVSALLKRG